VSNISHDASDISVLTYFVDGYWYSPIGRFIDDTQTHESDIVQIIKPAKQEVKFEPQIDEPVYSENGKRLTVLSIGKESYFLSDGDAHEKCDVYPINEYQYKNGFCTKS